MILVRVAVQLHHGHELEVLTEWPGEVLPSPLEVTKQMEDNGGIAGFTMYLNNPVPAVVFWDSKEASSVVVELSPLKIQKKETSLVVPSGGRGVFCRQCGEPGILGLDCGKCGTVVTMPELGTMP